MPTRYTVVCEDDQSRQIRELARKNGVTEAEVLRQLIDLGLEKVEEEATA